MALRRGSARRCMHPKERFWDMIERTKNHRARIARIVVALHVAPYRYAFTRICHSRKERNPGVRSRFNLPHQYVLTPSKFQRHRLIGYRTFDRANAHSILYMLYVHSCFSASVSKLHKMRGGYTNCDKMSHRLYYIYIHICISVCNLASNVTVV